jgi:hypothetical protein
MAVHEDVAMGSGTLAARRTSRYRRSSSETASAAYLRKAS